ncbi:restriction endonuclease subunit S [Variovorax sp. dw_954]|uniref:restriction endonuclease subunit S n=1 Tax=Variovorax sp. dw_954 TaxID=2720078 RepID=UPI001BD3D72E|nr:restriction endonuclease subunit S [Variovorax sp. dw_954]
MRFSRYPEYRDSGIEWLGKVPAHWEVRSFKHIVSTPITDGPHETPIFTDEGIPFVSAEAVSSGKIDFNKIRGFISETAHVRYSQKYRPQIGDIYMVKSGATTGITAIVESDADFNIWSPLAAIRCSDLAVPKFVLNFMRSKNFQEAVTLNWSFGTQQNIGMGVIENLAVPLPPVAEQAEIASILGNQAAKIDALVAEQQKLITLLKEKRQTVISHAVTKGIDPTVPMKDSGVEWLGQVPSHWEVVRNKTVLFEVDERHDEADGTLMTVSHLTGVTPRSEKNVNMIMAETLEGYKRARTGDLVINTMWAWMGALGTTPCDGLFSPS